MSEYCIICIDLEVVSFGLGDVNVDYECWVVIVDFLESNYFCFEVEG